MIRLRTAWPRRLDPVASFLGIFLSLVAAVASPCEALDGERESQLLDLVRQDCGSCHGMTLKGGLGRPLLPERFKDADTAVLASIILNGVRGTPMPPWAGLLSVEEATWIAEQLKAGLPR